jgi:hypothetical protein
MNEMKVNPVNILHRKMSPEEIFGLVAPKKKKFIRKFNKK